MLKKIYMIMLERMSKVEGPYRLPPKWFTWAKGKWSFWGILSDFPGLSPFNPSKLDPGTRDPNVPIPGDKSDGADAGLESAKGVISAATLINSETGIVSGENVEAQQRLQAIQNVEPRPNIAGVEKLLINEIREYRIQARAIIDREGQWTGQGADMEIAKKMCVMGYSQLHVTRALMNASVETADRTTEQAKQYGQEIYAQVMTPELQQSLSHRGHGLR